LEIWEKEKQLYANVYGAVLKEEGKIKDIPEREEELGYTTAEKDIYLAFRHPIIDALPFDYRPIFRYGVFAHEMLHQIYTDFSYFTQTLDSIEDRDEKEIVSLLTNLIEDPAIEYQAPNVIGGEMLESLRFSIRHIYSMSEGLKDSQSAFEQVVSALIMFGDSGVIKGRFSDEKAAESFLGIIGEFNQMVECPQSFKRIDAARRWAVLLRPLWKKDAEDRRAFEEILKKLQEQMSGPMSQSGSTNPEQKSGESPGSGNKGPESQARNDLAKALEKAGKSDVNKVLDERTKENGANDEGKPSDELIDMVWQAIREAKPGNTSDEDSDMPRPVNWSEEDIFSGTGTLNEDVVSSETDCAAYQKAIRKYGHEIRLLQNSLEKILHQDNIEWLRTTSGHYNIKRDLFHTSVRIFDKKREKAKNDDLAVMLLVDNSGSMSGTKVEVAKMASIMLAEALAALKIPVYIMGFTADSGNYALRHMHFVGWKADASKRASLMRMRGMQNNDDGDSIRCASRILARHSAGNKILFVLSDGQPACRRYRTKEAGLKDARLSINEARRKSKVFGIGIEYENASDAVNMYNGAFVNVSRAEDLPGLLAKQLRRLVLGG